MIQMRQRSIDSHQKYVRPSCLPALNLRFQTYEFFKPYYEKSYDQISIPDVLTSTPKDTLINYFSILREAENMVERSCGTIGNARLPFPIAYNFFSQDYQNKVSFEEYMKSFAGIGHTSLLKLIQIPNLDKGNKFFYEIETIEGFEGKTTEYFGYYYGFIWVVKEQTGYRISNIQEYPEVFLCAPYHGWDHEGETIVDVKYGNWCNLLRYRYPTIRHEYIKHIYFYGQDHALYLLVFFTLTNGTDIEIAQFRKEKGQDWTQVNLVPEKECIDLRGKFKM